jgi:dihydropyrimidinase
MVHAENGDAVELGRAQCAARGVTAPHGHALSRPPAVEEEATGRAIALAAAAGAPLYVVHVTCAGAARAVAAARLAGQRVLGEPVLAGIVLDESEMWRGNFTRAAAAVMSPPIRSAKVDGPVLRGGLASGVLGPLGTDHCSFSSAQKAAGRRDFRLIPNGVNGIGERMVLAWDALVASGAASPSDYVRVTSTQAAHAFNLYPRKGVIAVGSDADVLVFDPNGTTIVGPTSGASDTNVYEGIAARGRVVHTISRGRLAFSQDVLTC